ncbi:MAG: hypothetical protein AAF429_03905 [Pseudomonadota bacterium]
MSRFDKFQTLEHSQERLSSNLKMYIGCWTNEIGFLATSFAITDELIENYLKKQIQHPTGTGL